MRRALLVLVLTGCPSSQTTPAPVETVTPATTTAPQPVVSAPPEPPATPPSASAEPKQRHPANDYYPKEEYAKLGAACSAGQQGCGHRGRIALAVSPSTTTAAQGAPCDMIPLSLMNEGMRRAACVSGDQIWAVEQCMMCRLPNAGWAMHGALGEMTDDQHRELQSKLKLGGPLPRTSAEWANALKAGKK